MCWGQHSHHTIICPALPSRVPCSTWDRWTIKIAQLTTTNPIKLHQQHSRSKYASNILQVRNPTSPKLLKPPNPKYYLAWTAVLVLLPGIQAWRLVPGHDPRLSVLVQLILLKTNQSHLNWWCSGVTHTKHPWRPYEAQEGTSGISILQTNAFHISSVHTLSYLMRRCSSHEGASQYITT